MSRFNLKDLFRVVTLVAIGFGIIAVGAKLFSLHSVFAPLGLVVMCCGAVVASTGPMCILSLARERFD